MTVVSSGNSCGPRKILVMESLNCRTLDYLARLGYANRSTIGSILVRTLKMRAGGCFGNLFTTVRQPGSERLVALDRGPVHDAYIALVVERAGPVQEAAVIPHHQITFAPAVRVGEPRLGSVFAKLGAKLLSLCFRQAFHRANQVGADVDRFSAGYRMGTCDWMTYRGEALAL